MIRCCHISFTTFMYMTDQKMLKNKKMSKWDFRILFEGKMNLKICSKVQQPNNNSFGPSLCFKCFKPQIGTLGPQYGGSKEKKVLIFFSIPKFSLKSWVPPSFIFENLSPPFWFPPPQKFFSGSPPFWNFQNLGSPPFWKGMEHTMADLEA